MVWNWNWNQCSRVILCVDISHKIDRPPKKKQRFLFSNEIYIVDLSQLVLYTVRSFMARRDLPSLSMRNRVGCGNILRAILHAASAAFDLQLSGTALVSSKCLVAVV